MGPRELIINALEKSYPAGMTSREIRDALNGALDPKQASNSLYLMKQDFVIEQDEDKRYFLAKAPDSVAAKPAPTMADLTAKIESARPAPSEPVAEPEVLVTNKPAMSEELAAALDRLSVPFHQIEDSGLKVAVLDRLSEILDPSIADVLEGIKTDLVAVTR